MTGAADGLVDLLAAATAGGGARGRSGNLDARHGRDAPVGGLVVPGGGNGDGADGNQNRASNGNCAKIRMGHELHPEKVVESARL